MWHHPAVNVILEGMMARWIKAALFALALFAGGPALAAECGKGGKGPVTISYDTGKTALTADNKRLLVRFAEKAKFRDWVCIFSQVDGQGTKEANVRVAEGRAQTVKRFLISQGVTQHRTLIAKQEQANTLFGLLRDDQWNDRRVTVSYQ